MKVLFVDDSRSQLESYHVRSAAFPEGTQCFFAHTLAMAGARFRAHQFDAIVLDGCVPGDELNSLPFIDMVRARGYTGILVAASGSTVFRKQMMDAGCTHEVREKGQAIKLLLEVLNW